MASSQVSPRPSSSAGHFGVSPIALKKPKRPSSGRGGPAKPCLRQQRRQQTVARRVADAEALGRHAQHLHQTGGLRRGAAQRPNHLFYVEPEQPAGRRRRAEHAAARGDVPAPRAVVRRRDRIADPARDLDADRERIEQIDAAHALQLRQRVERRHDRRGRMDHGRQMGVAEVVDIGAGRVEKRRVERVGALLAADDRGRPLRRRWAASAAGFRRSDRCRRGCRPPGY